MKYICGVLGISFQRPTRWTHCPFPFWQCPVIQACNTRKGKGNYRNPPNTEYHSMPESGDNKQQLLKSEKVILGHKLPTRSPKAILKCFIRSPGQMNIKKKHPK
jgi:hypothetical protein